MQEWSLMNFFQKERKQEAHFDYCQRPLQADSTAHCKTVKEWSTHTFGMPITSNFMANTNSGASYVTKICSRSHFL